QIWSKLKHPNVLPFLGLYDVGQATPILVSPFCKFGHVGHYVRNHSKANRIQLVHDMAAGLKYLHDLDIAHGNLKVANVLVTSSFRACIADFGLSSIVNGMSSLQLTNSSMRARGGTLRYQAPELLNRGHHNSQSDVFAFACVAYECV
ncbi:kinase-like domain-containing protein, partial [Mycena sanguinolenta]